MRRWRRCWSGLRGWRVRVGMGLLVCVCDEVFVRDSVLTCTI